MAVWKRGFRLAPSIDGCITQATVLDSVCCCCSSFRRETATSKHISGMALQDLPASAVYSLVHAFLSVSVVLWCSLRCRAVRLALDFLGKRGLWATALDRPAAASALALSNSNYVNRLYGPCSVVSRLQTCAQGTEQARHAHELKLAF